LVEIIGMYIDYQLAHLAWSLIRDGDDGATLTRRSGGHGCGCTSV